MWNTCLFKGVKNDWSVNICWIRWVTVMCPKKKKHVNRHLPRSNLILLHVSMVAYRCPLWANYFFYDMYDKYVNMQHNFVDMQENYNHIRIMKYLRKIEYLLPRLHQHLWIPTTSTFKKKTRFTSFAIAPFCACHMTGAFRRKPSWNKSSPPKQDFKETAEDRWI